MRKIPIKNGTEEEELNNKEMQLVSANFNNNDNVNSSVAAVVDNKNKNLLKLYLVLDTNVLISNLNRLKEILLVNDSSKTNNSVKILTILIVPWIVILELDKLKLRKSKSNLEMQARVAIEFLLNIFTFKNHLR